MRRTRFSALRVAVVGIAAGATLLFAVLPASAHEAGRMTGGGSVFTTSGARVTHGFELHCISPEGGPVIDPNNLEVNWPGHRFHLDTLTRGTCWDDANIQQRPPAAPFDTFSGAGWGKCDGVTGAYAQWIFVDGGEPGRRDTATYTIDCPGSIPDLFVPTTRLTYGNHQAHEENK